MILDRRKIAHGSQEEIGYELGLIVPKEVVPLFTKVRTGKRPAAGYGTQTGKKRYSIDNFFKKNNIALKKIFYPVDTITGVDRFIIEHLKKRHDIMVCFNNKILHGIGDYGHICLIQGISRDIVTLIDSERNVPKKRKVKLSKLIEAIRYHGTDKQGGFWIVSE